MTRSKQINAVLEAARRRAGGDAAPELHPALDEADRMTRQMRKIFEAQLRFRERTPLLIAELPRIRASFSQMSRSIEALRHDPTAAGEKGLRDAFNALMDSLDALRAEEESWPIHSRSPYMNVLMRLATGVERGTIEPEALRQGLAEMLTQHQRFAASVDGSARPGPELERYKERRREIRRCLSEIERGLVEAGAALAAGDKTGPTRALKRACQAADTLADVQDEFRRAEEAAASRPCFRCGSTNARTSRHCVKCGGMLLPMPTGDDDAATIDVTIEDQVHARGHARTELTDRLQHAVGLAREGRLAPEKLARVLDEAEARLVKARREFEKLHAPADIPPEALDVAAMMRAGLQEFDEGLKQLRVYLLDGNAAHLDHGLEAALAGGDKIASIQALASRPETA